MKIVAFSDVHGQQFNSKLTNWFFDNPADLLLFAGDLQLNDYDNGHDFVDWVHCLPYSHKILIFGNHDGNYEGTQEHAIRYYKDITFLQNFSLNIYGIRIFGSPYSPIIPGHSWWFSLPDNRLKKVWKKALSDTDILLTHCPPYGILDETHDGIKTGSLTLLQRIAELKNLKYHVFGHIQESYGTKVINGKTFINASVLNERYELVNKPIIFDYKSD